MPIYILHGQNDPIIPLVDQPAAVQALKGIGDAIEDVDQLPAKVGAGLVVHREVPGAGHNLFMPWKSKGHAEWQSLMDWLLAHKRAEPADLDAAEKSLEAFGRDTFHWSPTRATQPGAGAATQR